MLFMTLLEGLHHMRDEPRILPKTRTYFNTIEEMDSLEFRCIFVILEVFVPLLYLMDSTGHHVLE